jgi:hypothetical protein
VCARCMLRALMAPCAVCVADVSALSKSLADNSKAYHWGTRKLNLMEWYKKYLPVGVVVLIILVLAYLFFLR